MRLNIAMAQFSEKYLTQLSGALYDAVKNEVVKPGFTVADILHAGIPMLTNSLLCAVALQRLIKDGVIMVKKYKGEYRYYLRYPVPTAYVPDPKEPAPEQKEVKQPTADEEKDLQEMRKDKAFTGYKTREMRADKPAEAPKKTQVGGSHYVNMAIQPVDYITKNNLGFLEGCVVKYVSRWKDKNGKEDLLKARHCIEMLLDGVDEAE